MNMSQKMAAEFLGTLWLVLGAEESPDDLQINHQIRVEAHLVA
ncbi:hypothetical protein [Shewanella xiamenensis]